MARTLTASDRKALIRLASTLEKGSPERKAILAGLAKTSAKLKRQSFYGNDVELYYLTRKGKVLIVQSPDLRPGEEYTITDRIPANAENMDDLIDPFMWDETDSWDDL